MKKIFTYLIFLLLIGIASCTKEGLQGPQGDKGDTGAVGATGAAGPAGDDGSVIYSGTGSPVANIGSNGDYYLDRSTGNLYGPKTVNGWGSSIALKGSNGANGATGATGSTGATGATGGTGATGASGADGSKILSGAGVPSNTAGANGDYYLDKSTYLLYGPKSNNNWGTPLLLRGAQGAQGPVGPAGADGSVIYSGTGVPDGRLGKVGDYYFNKTNGAFYGPKTADGWGTPTSLIGPAGAAGATGATGATGGTGATGATGAAGTAGSQVLSGTGAPSATLGNVGDYYLDRAGYQLYGPKAVNDWGTPLLLRGAQGAQGPVGPAGADGSVIFSGTTIPDASLGKNGDYYFNKSTGDLYGPKTGRGWGVPTSLAGQTGATGGTGATGAAGSAGSQILSGTGVPSATLGNNGDYYLDRNTYLLYGPKAGGVWGTPLLLRGAQGAQGPAGPAGADGSIIYSGSGAPDPALGKNGDYYFNNTSRSLYGPKTAGGWGNPTSLVGSQGATGATGGTGATGAQGADGSTILNGFGAPAASIGKIGDFYLDRLTYLFYGPKNADGWGRGTSLQGRMGNANVLAFETAGTTQLQWVFRQGGVIGTSGPPSGFVLRQQKATAVNDTSTFFKLPDTLAGVVNHGVVLVYMRVLTTDTTVHQWVQIPYTNVVTASNIQSYTYRSTANNNGVFIRIYCDISNATTQLSPMINIDKIRVVVVPQSQTNELNVVRNRPTMQQVVRKFNLSSSSFKTVQ